MAPRLNFLPDALSKTLLEFQQEGVLFGISKNGRCLIGDEMGLGKTLQALSIAYYYKNEWPLLIVCPSSMRFPWIEEIEKWLPDVQPQEVNLVQSGTDASNIKTSKISIVGYGLLGLASSRLLVNCLKEMRFGVVVVDESHYMKNRKAARTKALVSVIKQAKRAVLLTGTPALARPEELYVQIDVLKPNLLGSFTRFANRYCDAHTQHMCGGKVRKWNTQGASNLEELHHVLKSNVMIRRLKRHVLTQLPPKRRQRIAFQLAESESKKELGEVIDEFKNVCKYAKDNSPSQSQASRNINPFVELNRLAIVLYKQTGLSKITTVRQYIADILENSDKKFLVFAHHTDVMKAIEQEVIKKRVKYIRIAGDVPSVLRGSLVHQFQTDSSTRVAILSILAASMGITLTAADHVIFCELHWTPGVLEQAEDRVHRIGQENSVLVQYLVARGTIDEVLWRMLCNKVYVTTATLNGKIQGMDVEEGSEGQSKLLEAFSAWVMEDEEDEISEDEFLFTHSQKKRKQDSLQRSLMEFFHSPSTTKCRKTDNGKEWTESQDSPFELAEKDEDSRTMETNVASTSESDACVILSDSDEDNSLRKTTEKTYELAGKKRSPVVPRKIATVAASESQEIEWEFAREMTKMDVDATSEPASAEVVDMLSSYTRLLKKSITNDGNLESNDGMNKVGDIVEPLATSDEEGGLNVIQDSKKIGQDVENSGDSSDPAKNNEVEETNSVPVATNSPFENHDCFNSSETSSTSILNPSETKENESTVDIVDPVSQQTEPMPSTPAKALDEQNDSSDSRPSAAKSKVTGESFESEVTQTKAVPLPPTSAEDINDFKTWCCSICTFNNNAFLRVCEMCETPRYKSRRKSTNAKCSTDEFVARKQRQILEKCSPGDQKKAGKNGGKRSKKGRKGSVVVTVDNKGSSCKRTEDGIGLIVVENTCEVNEKFVDSNKNIPTEVVSESKPEILVLPEMLKPEGPVLPETPVQPEVSGKPEMKTKPEILVESEIPVKRVEADVNVSDVDLFSSESLNEVSDEIPVKLETPVERFTAEVNTSDVDLFASEEFSDEIVTSSCEGEIMTSSCETDTVAEDILGIASEFDDITDDDWWVCTSCKNFNYDDAADKCEACGVKKPGNSLEDLVTGLEDDCWRCEDCGEFNFGDDVIRKCTKCCHGDKKNRKSLVEQYKQLRHLIVDDEKLDGNTAAPKEMTLEHFVKPEVIDNLMFRLSNYTDRVYLYDGYGEPLNCNVNILDMEGDDPKNIPAILTEPSHREQILKFVRKWKTLQQRNRRIIRKAGIVFDDPCEALEAIKMGREQKLCTSRFPSKEKLRSQIVEAAKQFNGTIRHCVKPRGRRTVGCSLEDGKQGMAVPEDGSSVNDEHTRWVQAVDENGRPLCLSCRGVVDTKNTNSLWDERFCSHRCKEDYQCRVNGTRVREKLFQEEQGVCQKCGCNAHELYRQIKLLPKSERRSYLENTPFLSLPVTMLNRIIIDPKEGMFWEADHVVAVVEGGGECDLENYRTLCVPCHRQVTAELRERLRKNRPKARIAGIPDITSFFH